MPPSQPPQLNQQQLNESIERTKALMKQYEGMQDNESIIMNLLQNNPQFGAIANMVRNGQSLEGIAKSMAQVGGYDINKIIKQLST